MAVIRSDDHLSDGAGTVGRARGREADPVEAQRGQPRMRAQGREAGLGDRRAAAQRVNTASFPATTPASLRPISAPHIHVGREIETSRVRGTSSISMCVTARRRARERRGSRCSTACDSPGSRSLFLANHV